MCIYIYITLQPCMNSHHCSWVSLFKLEKSIQLLCIICVLETEEWVDRPLCFVSILIYVDAVAQPSALG